MMSCLKGRPAGLTPFGVQCALEICRMGKVQVELLEGGGCVGAVACYSVDVENGHELFEGIGVNMQDGRRGRRTTSRGNPRDVAFDDENDVGLLNCTVDAVAHAEPCTMVGWEGHVAASGVENLQTFHCVGKSDEFADCSVLAS